MFPWSGKEKETQGRASFHNTQGRLAFLGSVVTGQPASGENYRHQHIFLDGISDLRLHIHPAASLPTATLLELCGQLHRLAVESCRQREPSFPAEPLPAPCSSLPSAQRFSAVLSFSCLLFPITFHFSFKGFPSRGRMS